MSSSDQEPAQPEQEIARALVSTRKYGRVHAGLLARVARRALTAHGGRDALKAAKRILHELAGAFLYAESSRRAERLVRSLTGADVARCQEVCIGVLRLHTSSAERLPALAELYERIWAAAGEARGARRTDPLRVLDLACGLNPFALPWMGLAPGSSYHGIDADGRVVDLARLALSHIELPELRQPAVVEVGDVLSLPEVASDRFDVVLLLKALPTLERLAPGASSELLRRITVPVVVISTATNSLGRRSVRRLSHDALIERTLADSGRRQVVRFEMAGEAVIVTW